MIKKSLKYFLSFIFIIMFSFSFISCDNSNSNQTNYENIKLYNTDTKQIENVNLETYIEGVVAGEIENDSPIEALKAQAILARTFTLKFIEDNESKYKGADISTDITEAQAYNKEYINNNIKKAVKETKGIVLKNNNEYINAWFHANSGGHTSSAKEGLNINEKEPSYLKSIETNENNNNTKNFSWSVSFSKEEILNALRNMGVSITNISSFEKGEIGKSGRCLTFIIGGKEVSANTFRINIGSTKLKSTLIKNITINKDSVLITGYGYGHGVGLSQEYAKVLAKEGKNFKDIIKTFFDNVEFKNIN